MIMKTTKTLYQLSFILVAIAVLSSCRKKDTTEITSDDAADAVTYALESSTGGYADQVSHITDYTYNEGYGKTDETQTLQCGVPFDTSVSVSLTSSNITANYTHTWNALLSCNGSVPSSLTFSGNYSGNFSSPRMESSNTGTRNWVLTGLQPSVQVYTLNGSFSRSGSHTSKVRNKNTFNTTIQIDVTNLTVSKSTYRIQNGTGTAHVVCNVLNGNNYTYDGDIVFNSGTATLTINGNTYTIQLY